MPRALAQPEGSFGPIDRFFEQHGLPEERKQLAKVSLMKDYKVIKQLKVCGALNQGILVVEKKEGSRAGKRYVLKRIAFDPREGRILLREIEILHVLKHPNIIKFIDGCIPRGPRGVAELFVEYCDRGNLQDLLNKYIEYNEEYEEYDHPYEYIPESFVWHVFRSLASAMAYLHFGVSHDDLDNPPTRNRDWPYIVHRDIKPENILLKSAPPTSSSSSDSRRLQRSSYPTVVLADFVGLFLHFCDH